MKSKLALPQLVCELRSFKQQVQQKEKHDISRKHHDFIRFAFKGVLWLPPDLRVSSMLLLPSQKQKDLRCLTDLWRDFRKRRSCGLWSKKLSSILFTVLQGSALRSFNSTFFFPIGNYGLRILDRVATRQAPSRTLSCAAAQTSDQACLFITACSPGSVGKFSPTKPESNLQSPASLQRDQQYASQRNSFATHLSLLVGLLFPSSPLRYMVLSKITACFCEMRPQWVSPPACANLITSSGTIINEFSRVWTIFRLIN